MPPSVSTMRELWRSLADTDGEPVVQDRAADLAYVLADAFGEHEYRTAAQYLSEYADAAKAAVRAPRFRTSHATQVPTQVLRAWFRVEGHVPAALDEIQRGGLRLPLVTMFPGRRHHGQYNVMIYGPTGLGAVIDSTWVAAEYGEQAKEMAARKLGYRLLRRP